MNKKRTGIQPPSPLPHHTPDKIVSGGQTGVDRAALDVAIEQGIPHGGWCPRGRIAEDGSIPVRYQLTEHESASYPARTEQNVIDSDATLILYEGSLRGGSSLTKRFCIEHKRRFLAVRMNDQALMKVRDWLDEHRPRVLNTAGPRESTRPGIGDRTLDFLHRVLTSSGVSLFETDD